MKQSLCLIIIVTTLLAGCNQNAHPPAEEQPSKTNTEQNMQKEEPDPVKRQLENMTLEEKVTQLLYVGVQGTSLSDQERSMIQAGAGGVFLLGGNVESEAQLTRYMNNIKETDAQTDIPLFLGVDEEGGRVSRIPDTIENLPAAAAVGRSADEETARQAGQLLAEKVKRFGFNMDFAPVFDINSNPDNPVIGDRSYGTTAEQVSRIGTAVMKGIKEENVIPVVKHFPGHGDTSTDSHVQLPVVDKTRQEVENMELLPFQQAVEEGADMVMTGHLLFPAVDEQYPASLSKAVITGMLREQLHFDGVVVTDDMTMGAITNEYGMTEAAVQSLKAGADMVLIAEAGNGRFEELQNALLQAVKDGDVTKDSINKSVTRILQLKQESGLESKSPDVMEKAELNAEIRKWKQQLSQ
ncbi:beta-N-acetylhexosaminidase [Salibacterium halotolerans]|uniref:beta-N-acetylhexosaminidase n=1 Tax=Salibacterium halotolerans TaxID=1884432 RepID=A0A1I5L5W3_9BACI|nr:beta-N-acetylhexosaminidase [Salibacterium halotolerans]SFO92121.1 beta-N-acetylhexosaminidase [Salibacterium halotolerans]